MKMEKITRKTAKEKDAPGRRSSSGGLVLFVQSYLQRVFIRMAALLFICPAM
jgi:hypothetical protein